MVTKFSKSDVALFEQVLAGALDFDDMPQDLIDRLFDHFLSSGEMPYGTAKARDGDPYEWMLEHLPTLVSEITGSLPLGPVPTSDQATPHVCGAPGGYFGVCPFCAKILKKGRAS